MAKTDSELLEETRNAIDALTAGKVSSYTINGQSYTRMSLKRLWEQVEILEGRIERSKRGRFAVGVHRRPRV